MRGMWDLSHSVHNDTSWAWWDAWWDGCGIPGGSTTTLNRSEGCDATSMEALAFNSIRAKSRLHRWVLDGCQMGVTAQSGKVSEVSDRCQMGVGYVSLSP